MPLQRMDLHSHLLPGIDDGCSTFADSRACVERLRAAGFIGTVCTPHYWPAMYPDNIPAQVEKHVARLKARLEEVGLDYPIWPGGEVRIADETVSWFERHGVPTLGPSSYVLIDYWGPEWPRCGDEVIEFLFDNDYLPILAHPERMNFREGEAQEVIRTLKERGVWLQGNLNSFVGGEGDDARRRMREWLEEDHYDLIASDMHDPYGLERRLDAIPLLEQTIGADKLRVMLEERPREILGHLAHSS